MGCASGIGAKERGESCVPSSWQWPPCGGGGVRSDRRLTVDLLAILFGIGSWLGVNSVYVQLPLLVQRAPEGWNLPSFLVVTIQLGNIGPLLYTVAARAWPKVFRDAYLIRALLLLGSAAALATAFAYDQTLYVFGADRSVPLFITVFVVALVGCTSSVLFMPYMGRFRDVYLITYLIGEGFSGFVPSIVALVQGVGGNADTGTGTYEAYTPPPRFGTNVYFLISSAILLVSFVAFTLLDRLPLCVAEHAAVTIANGNHYTYEASSPPKTTKSHQTDETTAGKPKLAMLAMPEQEQESQHRNRNRRSSSYWLLLTLIGIMCLFGNGFFPSIQSYSCLPYGNVAYHLAVTLSSMANPAACFLAFFVRRNTVRLNVLLVALFVPFAAYAMVTALTSPAPPLMHQTVGSVLVVACWTVLIGLVSYVRLAITTLLRREGGQTLVWVGVASQLGSLAGSLLSFGLVNYTGAFEQYYPC
ncbi:hypothetical protein AND_003683 [Anopheles darlingi]|uniref:Riboflavin transporter n=1 Tax=Anopheles darlingi TaxID=43151 RepID=W5JJL2_ANODA|nr:hypothetical protein AND_003683 [Anopheles darlingi]